MDIGVCVASRVTDIDYVVHAERLGFSHAWMADSQMLWSDVYASLALAADRTQTINLGTGVAVSGTRPAAVNAASIATINALAPGRTFLVSGLATPQDASWDCRHKKLLSSMPTSKHWYHCCAGRRLG